MPDMLPGGAYLGADGKWHDAEGKPLNEKQIAVAEKLRDQRAAQVAEQERQALEIQARNDPIARSLTAALRPAQPEPDEPPARRPRA